MGEDGKAATKADAELELLHSDSLASGLRGTC
jgi:hypothetical protein